MDKALTRALQLLQSCGTSDAVLPATALYNEGWMLRLVLDWFARHRHVEHPLQFAAGVRWYSEGLLATQFRARARGDTLAEAWTHADGVIGHFDIVAERGDVKVNADARQLTVVEAKMFSSLSAGTKRAPSFNQAARNVACIAEVLHLAQVGPAEMDRLGFVVLAPKEQITRGVFAVLTDRDHIMSAIADRVSSYGDDKRTWHTEVLLPTVERMRLDVIAWEDIVSTVMEHDQATGSDLQEFLEQCLRFNGSPAQRVQKEILSAC